MMCKRSVLVFSLFVLWAVSSAHAVEGPFVGIDLGAPVPTNGNYRAHVQEGGIAVIVEGHTDSVGTDAYNQKLSHRRADGVRQYFVKHGIPANRVTTEGFGESRPVASNDTADGRAQNRRVELRVE